MEEKKNIFNISGKIHLHFLHWGRSPERDWKIIFVFAALFAFCSIATSAFIFVKIDRGEIFLAEKVNEESGETLDFKKLEETALYYKNKELELEKIIRSKPQYVDPSL